MANTSTLPLAQTTKETNLNPANVIGGLFEDVWEQITAGPVVNEGPVTGPDLEQLDKMPEYRAFGFPVRGSIENFQQPNSELVEAAHLVEARAAVEEAQRIVRQHAEEAVQESIRHELAGMPADVRNERLHLSTGLRGEHTITAYHMAEIYRQKKAELTALKTQEKNTLIPSPARFVSRDAQFEGAAVSTGLGGVKFHLSPTSGGPG